MTKWTKGLSVATATIALTGALPTLPAEATSSAQPTSISVSSHALGEAVNLKLTEKTRHKLADAFWNQYYGKYQPRPSRSKVDGPKNVYYGKIKGATRAKDVYWAVGNIGIKGDPVSYQDGPHVWRKRGHGAWSYRGDTGGCLNKAPKALLKIWHLSYLWCHYS
ncbi:hypothetical protein [Sphaerimonospora thailandensis]|nr:hypothetical protein [Sphaerimonospora thailandensis]